MATTDASGNVVNGYTYDVYGKTTASSGSQPNSFQFAGHQTDPTGLQYLRARYYDPSTGSFLSRDPLSAIPGWSGSPFGYAGASPSSNVDPTGNTCLGPVCIDRNGVSVGGHEATEGIAQLGRIVLSLGNGAIQIVKLAGEYSVRFGADAVSYLSQHADVLETLVSSALYFAVGACMVGGAESFGAACVPIVQLAGIYTAWRISRYFGNPKKSAIEQIVGTVVAILGAVPTGRAGDVIKNVIDSLEPVNAH